MPAKTISGLDALGSISLSTLLEGVEGGASGRLTAEQLRDLINPVKPAFHAYSSSTRNNVIGTAGTGAVTVEFDAEIFDTTSDFNTTTYTFTAPSNGTYLFGAKVRLEGITAAADNAILRIVTTQFTYTNLWIDTNDLPSTLPLSVTTLAPMNESETATVTVEVQGEASDVVDIFGSQPTTSFWGWKMG